MSVRIHVGDSLAVLRTLPTESINCCVTSPPYWGLRDYGADGQIGLESTPEEYVEHLVQVFREVRRALRPDGTLWLNLGDSYASSPASGGPGKQWEGNNQRTPLDRKYQRPEGLKPKDIVGIPWRVAFALQVDGWYLRQDIIWHKPNPMPESVQDRCTKAHEYVFLLAKSVRYYYDAKAVAEIARHAGRVVKASGPDAKNAKQGFGADRKAGFTTHDTIVSETRNRRSVWTITSKPFPGSHFATFPPELPRLCILAGCSKDGTVLDPFFGAGTTGLVADRLGRDCIGIEINPEYAAMAADRIRDDSPMFSDVEVM